ncbi:MAG: DUF3073 domain-containing protein [Mycobacteriaceae bacterium]
MGRGRAKAKQTKVARELKYSSPTTNFDSLQKELSGELSNSSRGESSPNDYSESDSYSRWSEDSDDWSR